MFSGEAARFEDKSVSRDAADGLGAIADALHQGLDILDRPGKARFWLADAVAIALGWALLVSVILYPALQLIAIAAGILCFSAKPLLRLVLGSPAIQPAVDGAALRREQLYSAV